MADDLSPEDRQQLLEKILPPYYEMVGRIASVWALFEQRMDQLIWDLIAVDHALGACVTSQLNGPSVRLRTIKTLSDLREWPEDKKKRLNKFDHSIRVHQDARNRAVHDAILVGIKTESVYRRTVATIDNKLVFETVNHSLDNLKNVYVSAGQLALEFEAIQATIRSSVPATSVEKFLKLSSRQGPESEASLPLSHSQQMPQGSPEASPP